MLTCCLQLGMDWGCSECPGLAPISGWALLVGASCPGLEELHGPFLVQGCSCPACIQLGVGRELGVRGLL